MWRKQQITLQQNIMQEELIEVEEKKSRTSRMKKLKTDHQEDIKQLN